MSKRRSDSWRSRPAASWAWASGRPSSPSRRSRGSPLTASSSVIPASTCSAHLATTQGSSRPIRTTSSVCTRTTDTRGTWDSSRTARDIPGRRTSRPSPETFDTPETCPLTNRSDRTNLPRASRRNGSTPATTTANVAIAPKASALPGHAPGAGADPGSSLPKSERRIERSSAHRPSVPLRRSADGMIRWSLTDDGRGISAEDEEHVFERFHIGAEDPGVGLGEGSALAYREPRPSPGHIAGPSTSGSFPPRKHVHPGGLARRTRGGGMMRILVVDDEPDVVQSVRLGFTLQWREVDVLGANAGEAALDIVEHEHPDIVLLDVGLPGIDGYEALRQIRAFSDVPVVMLTARDDAMDKVKGLELVSRARSRLRLAHGLG